MFLNTVRSLGPTVILAVDPGEAIKLIQPGPGTGSAIDRIVEKICIQLSDDYEPMNYYSEEEVNDICSPQMPIDDSARPFVVTLTMTKNEAAALLEDGKTERMRGEMVEKVIRALKYQFDGHARRYAEAAG